MLTAPHVTVDAFKAYPHYLDLDDLRSGDPNLVDQDDELAQLLLSASTWADEHCLGEDGDTLASRTSTDQLRLRPDRNGTVNYHPPRKPVTTVTSVAWGYTPDQLTTLTSGFFIERGRRIVAAGIGPARGMAALQFGSWAPGAELYTAWTYTAGYPSTVLAADVTAGAQSIQVADPAGIAVGQVLRLTTPGLEEALTVTAVAGNTLTLAAALGHAHTAGDGATGMPYPIEQAVIFYTMALLERGVPDAEASSGGGRAKPALLSGSVGTKDGGGLVKQATHLLEPYRRVV